MELGELLDGFLIGVFYVFLFFLTQTTTRRVQYCLQLLYMSAMALFLINYRMLIKLIRHIIRMYLYINYILKKIK